MVDPAQSTKWMAPRTELLTLPEPAKFTLPRSFHLIELDKDTIILFINQILQMFLNIIDSCSSNLL